MEYPRKLNIDSTLGFGFQLKFLHISVVVDTLWQSKIFAPIAIPRNATCILSSVLNMVSSALAKFTVNDQDALEM